MTALAYEYTALDRRGGRCRGVTRAPSEQDAFRQVRQQGLTPVSIRPVRARRGRSRRIRTKDVAQFTQQLGVLLGARIPVGEGLRGVAEQETNPRFRAVVESLASQVEAGQPIAQAMSAHRDVFGEVYVATVRAAEQSGHLVRVLEYLSEMLERADETRRQIRGALLYPLCVVTMLGAATAFLLVVIVPRFADMFARRGLELPAMTRLLLASSDALRSWWWVYVPATVVAVVLLRRAWRVPRWRVRMERALHRLPAVRQVLVGLAVGRFARVLGLCLSAGLGIIDCLALAGAASGRLLLARDVERMIAQVRTGGRLSDVLLACEYLPPLVRRMLAAGEASAELTRMCEVVARQQEREAASLTRNLATVLEPVLVLLIAMVVLVVALAIFLPMWNLVNLLQ